MKLSSDPVDLRQTEVVQFELEEWIDSSPFELLLAARIVLQAARKIDFASAEMATNPVDIFPLVRLHDR